MGKSLKGKQLGKGLGQRKDGLYYARCRNYRGEREERCFKTLPEAKNWRQEQLYLRLHPESQTVVSPNMTVDAWFNHPANLYDNGYVLQKRQRERPHCQTPNGRCPLHKARSCT